MTKRIIGVFVFLIVILVVVLWATRIGGKPQVIATPTPSVQVQAPDPAPTPEPKPVIEVSKPEKPVLTVEDPGGRLLVDDGFWPGFRIDPDGKWSFSEFRNIHEGTPVYAPSDGYATCELGDGQPDVIFIPGPVPAIKDLSRRESGIRLFNLTHSLEDYKFLRKGDLIGVTRQEGLTFFESFDKTINFGFEAGTDLAKVLEKLGRPTDQRQLLLLMIQESKKINSSFR